MAKKGDLVVYERSGRPTYAFGSKVKPADEKSRKSYDVEMVTSATKEGKVKATQGARYAQPGAKGTPVDKWRPEPALTIPAERLGDIGGIKQALGNRPGWSDSARAKSAEVRGEKAATKAALAKLPRAGLDALAEKAGLPAGASIDEIAARVETVSKAPAGAKVERVEYGPRMVEPTKSATVISSGIRDSSGALHTKGSDNSWSIDKSAPEQIAPKGEISVPGDKGKVQKPRLSNPDVKALLKEGVITKDDVKRSKTMDDVRSIADRSRANRNADRGIDRPAPRPLSPMEQAAKNATSPDVPKVAEAAKGAGTPVPPKPSSGLRGTQNEANKAAIVENKKGKAKGKPLSPMEAVAKAKTHADVPKVAEAVKNPGTPIPPETASRAPLDIGSMVREKAAQVMAETKPIVDPLKLIDKRNETARSLAEQTKFTGVDAGRGNAARDLVARNDRSFGPQGIVKTEKPVSEMSNAEKVRTLNATAMGAKRKVFNEPAKPSPAEAYESKFGHKPPSGMSAGAMERWTSSPFKAAPGTPGDPAYEAAVKRAQSKFYTAQYRNIAASAAKPAATPPAPKAPAKSGKAVTRALAALGPVAIGASAVQAAGEVRAQGGSTSDMIKAGGKAAAGTTAGIGGFMIGQAAAVKGAVKLGMSVAKAVPMVNAAMIVGGAVHGAWTHRNEGAAGMAKGAAQGAWDMSLPGMVVNTGLAVKDAAKAWQTPAGPTSFQAASDRFSAMRHAASQAESGDKKKGWSNAARIGAYKARMAKSGGDATNLPYGGAVDPPKPLKG